MLGSSSLFRELIILSVFSLHNAWNCLVFLNFSNYGPGEALFGVGEGEIGLITTLGWVGILSSLPVVTLCRWHRLLLFAAGLLNTLAPIARYVAAEYESYLVVLLTNFAQGAAFGVIGAWPPMLAMQWPEERRTLVTAIAALSNYVGGAAGVVFMPLMATDGPSLLGVFRFQAYISVCLLVLMISWFWIPPIVHAEEERSLYDDIKFCFQQRSFYSLGLIVGLSLVLQGCTNFILEGVGYTAVESGSGNSVYQLSAAVAGVVIGNYVHCEQDLVRVLHRLRGCIAVAVIAFTALCWAMHEFGRFVGCVPIMITVMISLGISLMGILPFCLQRAVYIAHPASENVSSGCLYLIVMVITSGLTQLVSVLNPIISVTIIFGLILFEMVAFFCFCLPDNSTHLKLEEDDLQEELPVST